MTDEDRYTRITLRLPRDLHDLLAASAYGTSKSLNAEIVGRLMSSVGMGSAIGEEEARLLRFETDELMQRLYALDARLELIRTRLDAVKTRHSLALMRRANAESLPEDAARIESRKFKAEIMALAEEEESTRTELAEVQSMRASVQERHADVARQLALLSKRASAKEG